MSLWLKDIPVSVEARLDLTFYSHEKMERTCFVKKLILTNELVRNTYGCKESQLRPVHVEFNFQTKHQHGGAQL